MSETEFFADLCYDRLLAWVCSRCCLAIEGDEEEFFLGIQTVLLRSFEEALGRVQYRHHAALTWPPPN